MRVLFVTHSFPRQVGDGAGAFIHRLALALKRREVDVEVLAPSAPGLGEREAIEGVEVHRYRYAPRAWETLAYEGTMAEQVSAGFRGKLALLGMLAGARRDVRRLIAERQPDIIHAHWWFPSALAATYALGATPLVVTLHGSDVRLATTSAFAPMLFRRVARRAATMTAVSQWLADQAATLGAPMKPTVASMPVDIDRFALNAGSRARSVLFVGRLNAQKGPADLVTALASLPADVTADFVGDGPDRPGLAAQARQLGLESRLRWHGQLSRSAIISLYRQALVVVMPSREEGLGLVAVEALLTGTPVVAYRSGGVAELIEDGVTGMLVAPGNTNALAGSVRTLFDDPARARRMGAEGRERMLGRFSPDTVAATYQGIYTKVLGR